MKKGKGVSVSYRLRHVAVAAALCVMLLATGVTASAAPAGGEVSIRPVAISVTRVKALEPDVKSEAIATPGVELTLGLRVPANKAIRSIEDVQVTQVRDDRGLALPVVEGPVEVVEVSDEGGRRKIVTSSQEAEVKTTYKPRLLRRVILGEKPRTEVERMAAAKITRKTGLSTATLALQFGLPSPDATVLQTVRGEIVIRLAGTNVHRFENLAELEKAKLNLDTDKFDLKIDSVYGANIEMSATGQPNWLGEVAFFDAAGNQVFPSSVGRSESMSDGSGVAEMQYGFGDKLPAAMTVEVYVEESDVAVPFAFQNLPLP
jgi:hypothetical protein